MCKNLSCKTYYYLWVEENLTWKYYTELPSSNDLLKEFPSGYVDYKVVVNSDGIIIEDTYSDSRVGKKFEEFYEEALWELI